MLPLVMGQVLALLSLADASRLYHQVCARKHVMTCRWAIPSENDCLHYVSHNETITNSIPKAVPNER